jgi:hypothetical protein
MARKTRGIQKRRSKDGTLSYRAQVRLRGHEHLSKAFARKSDAVAWLEATRTSIRQGQVIPPGRPGERRSTRPWSAMLRARDPCLRCGEARIGLSGVRGFRGQGFKVPSPRPTSS